MGAAPGTLRPGKIDLMLVNHLHRNHVADRRIARVNAGECPEPETSVAAAPNTNNVVIALSKGAKTVTDSEVPRFFAGWLR